MSVIMVIGGLRRHRSKNAPSPHSDKVAGGVCVAMCQIRAECCCCAPDVTLLHPTEAMRRKLESLHAIINADAFLLKHILYFATCALERVRGTSLGCIAANHSLELWNNKANYHRGLKISPSCTPVS